MNIVRCDLSVSSVSPIHQAYLFVCAIDNGVLCLSIALLFLQVDEVNLNQGRFINFTNHDSGNKVRVVKKIRSGIDVGSKYFADIIDWIESNCHEKWYFKADYDTNASEILIEFDFESKFVATMFKLAMG